MTRKVASPAKGTRPITIEKVRHGKYFGVGGNMPLYSLEALSDAQLSDILAYLEKFGLSPPPPGQVFRRDGEDFAGYLPTQPTSPNHPTSTPSSLKQR